MKNKYLLLAIFFIIIVEIIWNIIPNFDVEYDLILNEFDFLSVLNIIRIIFEIIIILFINFKNIKRNSTLEKVLLNLPFIILIIITSILQFNFDMRIIGIKPILIAQIIFSNYCYLKKETYKGFYSIFYYSSNHSRSKRIFIRRTCSFSS